MVEANQKAPEFCLKNRDEHEICLNDFKGKWVVLYFYPKDNTSGCTLEAVDFTRVLSEFHAKQCEVIGISPDSVKSHCNFVQKHDLQVELLSDPDHELIEQYNAWVLKKMYGREYFGVERSTFIIDPQGLVRQVWRKVKVKEHVNTVLKRLVELQNQ